MDVSISPTEPAPSPATETTAILASAHVVKVLDHHQYHSQDVLSPSTVSVSPLDHFRSWFTSAQPYVSEPEAMSLSTVSSDGIPSSRMVLLKQADDRGFVFYTNYASRKSQEIEATHRAALTFYWREVHRQVRVVGRVERVSRDESEAYFRSRPLGSRIGAWASPQSQVLAEGEIDERVREIRERFGVQEGDVEADIPLPEHWGGWRVLPDEVEFWAGKPSRLHDRVRYLRKQGNSPDDEPEWTIERLSP